MQKILAVLASLAIAVLPLTALASTLPCTVISPSLSTYGIGGLTAGTCGGLNDRIGQTVIFSGFTGDFVEGNGSHTLLGHPAYPSIMALSPTISTNHGIFSGTITVSAAPTPPAPPVRGTYAWADTGAATSTVSGIAAIVGGNFDGLAIIGGLIIGIPLLFYIIEKIIGWFREDERKYRSVIDRADRAIAESRRLRGK